MLGILCGLKTEANIADRIPIVLVGCSAGRVERAFSLARHMAEQGVSRLVSFGVAAGISPDLEAGDLIIGSTVMTAHEAWETDPLWNQHFLDALPSALNLSVWGSNRMAALAKDKALIYRRTGCMALDMESHIVARVAQDYGLPFNVIRAISDPADVDLPPAACVPLKEEGEIDGKAIWRSIRSNPSQIPDLARLALGTARAMRSLRQAIDLICETEGMMGV